MQAAPGVIRWVTKVVPYLSGCLTWAKNDYKRVTGERLSVRQTRLRLQKTTKRECEGLVRKCSSFD